MSQLGSQYNGVLQLPTDLHPPLGRTLDEHVVVLGHQAAAACTQACSTCDDVNNKNSRGGRGGSGVWSGGLDDDAGCGAESGCGGGGGGGPTTCSGLLGVDFDAPEE